MPEHANDSIAWLMEARVNALPIAKPNQRKDVISAACSRGVQQQCSIDQCRIASHRLEFPAQGRGPWAELFNSMQSMHRNWHQR